MECKTLIMQVEVDVTNDAHFGLKYSSVTSSHIIPFLGNIGNESNTTEGCQVVNPILSSRPPSQRDSAVARRYLLSNKQRRVVRGFSAIDVFALAPPAQHRSTAAATRLTRTRPQGTQVVDGLKEGGTHVKGKSQRIVTFPKRQCPIPVADQ